MRLRRPLSAQAMQELLRCLALLEPMAGTDLKAPVHNMVMCSDASESGGGLCASGGLTTQGQEMLKQLHSKEFLLGRQLAFAAQGAIENRSCGVSF